MDTQSDEPVNDSAVVSELARAADCFTDDELTRLAKVKASTTEAWRKRGIGPAYVRFGNAILYPRLAVTDYLKTLVRERSSVPVKSLL